jgi:prevent-host-death family protein
MPVSVPDVAARLGSMTLHGEKLEVGVRELHDRLSEYLEKVERGADLIVTRRGKPLARITGAEEGERPIDDLIRRGLIRMPKGPRTAAKPLLKAKGSVSDLVKEQRR